MGDKGHMLNAGIFRLCFAQEETGYKVSPENVMALGPAIASAGTSGAQHFMFYAEVGRWTCPGSYTLIKVAHFSGPVSWYIGMFLSAVYYRATKTPVGLIKVLGAARCFCLQVDESMHISSGGSLVDHGELIEVLGLPLEHAEAFLMDPKLKKSPGLMFGVLWAFHAIKAGKVR